MNTNTNSKSMVQAKPWVVQPDTSPDAQALMNLGRRELWDFAVLGQAPMPEDPVRLGDWLIVPAHQDTSEIPDRAMARIQAIFAVGIRPKGFVLVHEAPMLLPSPERVEGESLNPQWQLDPEKTQKVIETLSFGVTSLAKVLAGAVAVAAAVGAVVVPAIFMAGLALIDPILIAVTEDDYWIEIDRWWV